tara:strand:+ start:638 stop:766 length:129 start_codon:yes stop_codon:yes gene_type:complete
MNFTNVVEIMTGSILAIILVSVIAERSTWFNSRLTKYQGGSA